MRNVNDLRFAICGLRLVAPVGSALRTISLGRHDARSAMRTLRSLGTPTSPSAFPGEPAGRQRSGASSLRVPQHDRLIVLACFVALLLTTISLSTARGDAPATQPAAQQLFDGKSLDKWKPTKFGGEGEVHVEDGCLIIESGVTLSGANYTGQTPKVNYEVELDGKKIDGNDFFCGLTVPVGDSFATLVLGGWGGTLCGISSIDGSDAAGNETAINLSFKKNQWYHIRFRILENRLMAWVDKLNIIDVDTTNRAISLRAEVEPSKPFGLSTYQTTGAFKNIQIRKLTPKEIEEGKHKPKKE